MDAWTNHGAKTMLRAKLRSATIAAKIQTISSSTTLAIYSAEQATANVINNGMAH